jgi:hypothetical protein
MPYDRPGRGVYVTNTATSAAIQHGSPQAEKNYVGVAVKQVATGWDSTVAKQSEIEDDEAYFLITKGVVQVADPGGLNKGDAVYITVATGVLTGSSGSGKVIFGRVFEKDRGTPSGFIRIDLDAKDSV